MFCNNCGNELPENARFCNSCGAAVAAVAKKTCLNCGNELVEDAVFCNACGAKCGTAPIDISMPAEEMEYCCRRGLECLNAEAFSAAREHFMKAAEAGHAESQYQLACVYRSGMGRISKNEQAAVKWYFKAAMQGHADAQYSLSRQYITGEGVEQDFAAAARWLRLSTEQNCANALLFLGFLHDPIELNTVERKAGEENIIIPADVNKAREYYTKAMENGSQNARLYLARLLTYISIAETVSSSNDQAGTRNAVIAFMKCLESLLNSDMKSVSLYGVSQNFSKKFSGALSFAILVYGELPLMTVDSTITGSGRNGLLLTSKALYFKDVMAKTVKFNLDKLPEFSVKPIDNGFYHIFVNGVSVNIPFEKAQSVELLIFIVRFLANGFNFINKMLGC